MPQLSPLTGPAVKLMRNVKMPSTTVEVHQGFVWCPSSCSLRPTSLLITPAFTGKSLSLLDSTDFKLCFAEMLRMQFMEETVTIMASVDFVWNSPGLSEVGVGGPVVQGMGLLQDDLTSEFLFQVCSHHIE